MKKAVLILITFFSLQACSPEDNNNGNNPNLVDLNIQLQLDLDFAEFNDLKYPGNSYTTYNYGIKGIVVYNLNNSQYIALELSDPNHPPGECSAMVVDGITAKCPCDDGNEYNIITGEQTAGNGQYAMKPYRVEKHGNIIVVSN
ncbi:hypothetical protein [Zunongwangia sp. H14]|uniref:hypothetical protein n=1 Tax=Zunongwangia sp. H14 TaxID=3240792 RepID=UPI003567AF04